MKGIAASQNVDFLVLLQISGQMNYDERTQLCVALSTFGWILCFEKKITNEQYFGEKVPVAQNMIGMSQYGPIACSSNDFLFNRNKTN